MQTKLSVVLLACMATFGCGSSGSGSRSPAPPDPTPLPPPTATFHCSADSSCPEKTVVNDPPAMANGQPVPFRGYGDPSLEYDEMTGTLWMSYSWLNIVLVDPGPPPWSSGGVRTHLARSTDNGLTFQFVRAVNEVGQEQHPDTGETAKTRLEVSTLDRLPDGRWQMLWLKVLDFIDETSDGVQLWRSLADNPADLGDQSEIWIGGNATSDGFNAPINLSDLPELSQCAVFTEPALFVDGNVTYLALNCVVSDAAGDRDSLSEQLVLLRQESAGYSFVGTLTDGLDAVDLGGNRLEQADISVARDGSILLIVTPVVDGVARQHNGCIVLEFDDIATATLSRDDNGKLLRRYVITADGDDIGAGLCTYDAASETGVLIVTPREQGNDVVYQLRETGIHP